MRKLFVGMVLALGVGAGVGGGPARACVDASPLDPGVVVAEGLVAGDHLVARDEAGKVVAVNLNDRKITTLLPAGGLCLAASKTQVAVGTKDGVRLFDLATGRAGATVALAGPVQAVALDGERLVVQAQLTVSVVDLPAGKVAREVTLKRPADTTRSSDGPASRVTAGTAGRSIIQLAGPRAVLTHPAESSLVVLDLPTGKQERIPVAGWRISGLRVDGDRALVVGARLGYGVWTESLGAVDLKTGKYTALKLPKEAGRLQVGHLVSGSDGLTVLTGSGFALALDREGRSLGTLAGENAGPALGEWNRHAVVVSAGRVVFQQTPVRIPGR